MSGQRTSITQDLEHLFKKTTDANKIFFTESAKFVKQLSSSNIKGEELVSTQKELFKDAINLFVKLNIQHVSNLIDLGTAITKRLNHQFEVKKSDTEQEQDFPNESKPAFVLNVSGAAGTTATTQFLLDSDKKDPVLCNLKQTEYILQSDNSVNVVFETVFTPQSFTVFFGKPQKIGINIKISDDAKEGVYESHIQAEGFEHIYFTLFLTVTAPNDPIN